MSVEKQRPDPQKSLVGFLVGDVAYAVPIGAVREIISPIQLTSLPHAPPAVAGVADHRGEVVPVIDLRIRFGLGQSQEGRRPKWILLNVEGHTVGIVVDQVTDVFGTGGLGLRPPPRLGDGDERRGLIGVTDHDGTLVFVLDVERFRDLTAPFDEALLRAEEPA